MTTPVDEQGNRVDHDPNGIQTEFAYDFQVNDANTLFVFADSVAYTEPFSVTGLEEPLGGIVEFDDPPLGSIDVLTIQRILPLTQETSYPAFGPFPPKSHENALDKLTYITQQMQEQLDRSLIAAIGGDPDVSYELPPYEAGKAMLWDADTKKISNSIDTFNNVVTDAKASEDAAAISAAAALLSENNAAVSEDNTADAEARVIAIVDSVVTSYSSLSDYDAVTAHVIGSNGIVYRAALANGPSTLVVDPVGDNTGTWLPSTPDMNEIGATVLAGALTATMSAGILFFRDVDLIKGAVTPLVVDAPLSLTVPSGATLGSISAIQSELILIAINYIGTVELAIVNILSEGDLSETGLITTVAIDATADSNNVFYSETARVGVPYRVVGSVVSTQATAGTWITDPMLVQGYGGQALASMSSLGYGQTWQDVYSSRTTAVTYYNVTGRPIQVAITTGSTTTSNTTTLTINDVIVLSSTSSSNSNSFTMNFIIPIDGSYVVTTTGSTGLRSWAELR